MSARSKVGPDGGLDVARDSGPGRGRLDQLGDDQRGLALGGEEVWNLIEVDVDDEEYYYYYYGCFNVGLGRRPVGGRRRTRIRSDIVKMTRPSLRGYGSVPDLD